MDDDRKARWIALVDRKIVDLILLLAALLFLSVALGVTEL